MNDVWVFTLISIIADVMTILGIGGFLSWGIFRRANRDLPNRAYEIFTYTFRLGVVIFFTIFVLAILLFLQTNFSYIAEHYIWIEGFGWEYVPLGLKIFEVGAVLLLTPWYIASTISLLIGSWNPLNRLTNSIFPNRDNQEDE
ncbi:MAG: hypothetical protein DWQ07_08035 [Chloroflexi bacterium]|nr:MAG: hypothetical protein DWQ07_08035 [Chloroflexota bacterium]MBL1197012.1 hypothetical protein [Chloroflexota bacterium]NOH14307.1 hypothetical protein [Chloroflexota bacterium]